MNKEGRKKNWNEWMDKIYIKFPVGAMLRVLAQGALKPKVSPGCLHLSGPL